jgi:hypothetical protein
MRGWLVNTCGQCGSALLNGVKTCIDCARNAATIRSELLNTFLGLVIAVSVCAGIFWATSQPAEARVTEASSVPQLLED